MRRILVWQLGLWLLVSCGDMRDVGDAPHSQPCRQNRSIRNGEIAPAGYGNILKLRIGFSGVCTATVIRPNVLLTAAHCVQSSSVAGNPSNLRVLDARGRLLSAVHYRVHPGYTGVLRLYRLGAYSFPAISVDLALVSFGANLGYASRVVSAVSRVDQTELTVVGFGHNETHQLGVRRIGRSRFYNYLPVFESNGSVASPRAALGLLPDDANSQIACSGDSGGPALDPSGRVVGVVSAAAMSGSYHCQKVTSATYTFVSAFESWISSNADELVRRDLPQSELPPASNPDPAPSC